MGNLASLFSTILMSAAILCVLLPIDSSLAEISGVQLVDLLRQKDADCNIAGRRISFNMTTEDNQFGDPNQGKTMMRCEATQTEDSFAMKIVYDYEHPPIFASMGTRGYAPYDYDPNGNLIVWRTVQEYVLSAPNRNGIIQKLRAFRVAPNGEIVRQDDNTRLHRFRIGSSFSKYRYSQFEQAVGRGFVTDLGTVKSTESLPTNLIHVTSQGSRGLTLKGTWQLTLDPNSDWLVREANFTRDGADKPTVVVTSTGTVTKGKLQVAKYGTFKYSNALELSVEVTAISEVVARNRLYEEVLSQFTGPLPPGSQISDFPGDKPVRSTVE